MNTTPAASESTLTRLSVVDRFLPGWIITAKALGLGLGRLVPDLNDRLDTVEDRQQLPQGWSTTAYQGIIFV